MFGPKTPKETVGILLASVSRDIESAKRLIESEDSNEVEASIIESEKVTLPALMLKAADMVDAICHDCEEPSYMGRDSMGRLGVDHMEDDLDVLDEEDPSPFGDHEEAEVMKDLLEELKADGVIEEDDEDEIDSLEDLDDEDDLDDEFGDEFGDGEGLDDDFDEDFDDDDDFDDEDEDMDFMRDLYEGMPGKIVESKKKSDFEKVKAIAEKGQYGKVGKATVDITTAGMILTLHKNISPENQKKYEEMPIHLLIHYAFKLL